MNQQEIFNLEILVKSDLEKFYSSNIIKCSNDLFLILMDYKNYNVRSLNIKDELNSIIKLAKVNKENYKSILLESNGSSDSKLLLIEKDNITLIFNPYSTYYYILDKELNFIYAVTNLENSFGRGISVETEEHIFDNKNLTYMIKNKETHEYDVFVKYYMKTSVDSEKYSLVFSFLDFYREKDIHRKLQKIDSMNYNFDTEKITVEIYDSPITIFTFDSRLNLKEITLDLDIYEKLNVDRKIKVNSYDQFLNEIKDSVSLLELGTDDHITFFDQNTFKQYMDLFKKIAVDRKSYYENERLFKKILDNTYYLHSFDNKVRRYANQYKHMKLDSKIAQVHPLLSILTFSKINKENINSFINQEYIDTYNNKRKIINNIKMT